MKRAGISDLVLGDRKFSGNSLRCKRDHFLYHGTLLYQFPLEQIGELLKMPARQPNYRQGRPHGEFVMNLPLDATIAETITHRRRSTPMNQRRIGRVISPRS